MSNFKKFNLQYNIILNTFIFPLIITFLKQKKNNKNQNVFVKICLN